MSMFLRRRSTTDLERDDPLTRAMAPPENELPEETEARLLAQAEAQKRSDAIDEEINRQRIAERKAPKCVRMLLLGMYLQLFTLVINHNKDSSAQVRANQVKSWLLLGVPALLTMSKLPLREIDNTEK